MQRNVFWIKSIEHDRTVPNFSLLADKLTSYLASLHTKVLENKMKCFRCITLHFKFCIEFRWQTQHAPWVRAGSSGCAVCPLLKCFSHNQQYTKHKTSTCFSLELWEKLKLIYSLFYHKRLSIHWLYPKSESGIICAYMSDTDSLTIKHDQKYHDRIDALAYQLADAWRILLQKRVLFIWSFFNACFTWNCEKVTEPLNKKSG